MDRTKVILISVTSSGSNTKYVNGLTGGVVMNVFRKVLISLTLIFTIILIGFIAFLFTTFLGLKFYTLLTLVISTVLLLYVVLRVFRLLHTRVVDWVLAGILVLCLSSVGVYESYQAYDRSITIGNNDVNLYEYEPFLPDTKAVGLEEESTLQLEGDLPRVDGATALYPLYAAFAQAVYPEKAYPAYNSEVMSSTTPIAYMNLIKGEVDLIFAAEPSEEQLADAKRNGVELKLTPIGREAFVFFVNSSNPVKGLTTEQIQGIYSGKITNWREVGGNNDGIRAFQRPEGSGSQTALRKVMAGQPLLTPPQEDVVNGMGGMITETAQYRNHRNALGFSFLFFATDMVRNGNISLLSIDGVPPTRENIANGTYPLAAEFYAVTRNTDNPNVERFIEWILSPQGQSLVEKTGYTPL